MTCKTVEKYLSLPEEKNSPRQQNKIDEHLEQCERCRELAQQYQVLNHQVRKMQNIQPEPFGAAPQVLAAIRREQRKRHPLWEHGLDLFARRPVHILVQTAVVLLLVWIGVQEVRVHQRLAALEQRLATGEKRVAHRLNSPDVLQPASLNALEDLLQESRLRELKYQLVVKALLEERIQPDQLPLDTLDENEKQVLKHLLQL